MTRRLRTAAVSVALIAVLAGCGGGSSSSSSKTTDKATTPGNAGTNGSTDNNSTDSSSPDASVTIDTTFTGEGSSAVCNYAKDLDAADLGDTTSGTDLKASFTKIEEVLNNIKDKAPDEIKADVNTMFDGYQKLIDLYKKYDYDTAKMIEAASNDPDLAAQFASISSADITAATARVSAYFSNVCGITETTT